MRKIVIWAGYCHHTSIQLDELQTIVKNFIECEDISENRTLSNEDQWVVDFFKKTHRRKENGMYEVRLPFKFLFDPNQALGKSEQMALKRFRLLERKLNQKSEHCQQYSNGIQEYFDLNQIQPVQTSEAFHSTVNSAHKPHVTCSVLPHHAVINEDSSTTRVRIVFDASAKTSNGKSLNDLLCIGPKLQNDLNGVLNWRLHKFVFTADIQKMYRRIDMHPEDTQYQRIWWYDENSNPKLFYLTTVTFGTASAPCTAILTIHQIAEDERDNFPLAYNVLKNEIYVDDVQSGKNTVEETLQVRDQLINALDSAGMKLRKWAQ